MQGRERVKDSPEPLYHAITPPESQHAFAIQPERRCRPAACRPLWGVGRHPPPRLLQGLPLLQGTPGGGTLQWGGLGPGGAVRGLHTELRQGTALRAAPEGAEPPAGTAAGPRGLCQAQQDRPHRQATPHR